ncbi:Mef1, mitochondrial translation elongation factor EF-G [Tribonema minus]|uniref:Elongation factor G, mitochondrial n=1 Tax=Tribonema minus TaxID=303371 RepID=A0A836CCY0_9STRA|nr:Mef1, mitochondrial translation elongation factor EF-G [Tribonema minus]
MANVRNIGISAHIDSGKTTLTERILFYTGRIKAIHDVRGRDGVGAKMDSMELEREKGITIQSAATFCSWGDAHVNIIDTPGHVDFTIEVERALRVLDGAVLVLCGVSGVQSQSLTVDRQMKRYGVPRLAFINKLDRVGSSPRKVIADLRNQLKLNAAAVQVPIGLEAAHDGVVDVIRGVAYYFRGEKGEMVEEAPVPEDLKAAAAAARQELVERVADVDEEVAELFICEEDVPKDLLKRAIRRQTIAQKFVPVFMGSAYKNRGVQPLLDGVVDYLPSPAEVPNFALDTAADEARVALSCDPDKPTVALAFKLEECKFGQLTYMRVYQGRIERGHFLHNLKTGKKIKVPRLVRMHSNEMEEVTSAGAGDVVAMFGVDCASMDTFTDGTTQLAMSSMFVPEPVMSLAIKPDAGPKSQASFAKALQRFTKEDPTLRVHTDVNSKEIIISGMGELHLDVYVERLKREYAVECQVGRPSVNYRETISRRADFNHLHKKQTGGSGQYARVIGYIEPLEEGAVNAAGEPITFEFVNDVIGTNIPPEYIPSCGKGFADGTNKGGMIGAQVQGMRVVLTDGQAHAVDSSDLAFRTAAAAALRGAMKDAGPAVLEPIMALEVTAPAEFQGTIVSGLNKRMGLIQSAGMNDDGSSTVVRADVPLSQMFGYSTDLRSSTQGKGEFAMEYKEHLPVTRDVQERLVKEYQTSRDDANKK